jgi:hypothetical protein
LSRSWRPEAPVMQPEAASGVTTVEVSTSPLPVQSMTSMT